MNFSEEFNYEVSKVLSRFDSRLNGLMQDTSVPGIAAAIFFDQEAIYAEGHGYADLEARIPITLETIFRVGSLTKVFTATGIMQLRDDAALRLEDPASDYLHLPTKFKSISLRHLLCHTSGLPREAPLDYMETLQFPDIDAIVETLRNVALMAEPGSEFSYSNLGYALLAQVIEVVAGAPYKAFVIDRILRRIGMHWSGFDLTAEHRSRAALGYTLTEPPEPAGDLELDIGGFASAGQMYSSIEDLSQFLYWQFSADSHVLAAQSRLEMYDPFFRHFDGRNEIAYGWGYSQRDGFAIVGQNGRTFGYSADMALVPEFKLGAIILANAGFDPVPLRHLTETALEDLVPTIAAQNQ